MGKPEFLISAQPAKLFPVFADTNREQRMTSIFLCVLCHVPDLAKSIMGSVGVKVGARSKLQAFSEVVLRGDVASKSRPDGLLLVTQGTNTWSALVETKVAGNALDEDQVKRYVEVAREHGIDAVITISNQFVSRADQSPVSVPRTMLRKTSLFHWSWSWLATQCEILQAQQSINDTDHVFLTQQFLDFLSHPKTGVERFTQMPPAWKDVVQDVTNGTRLLKTSHDVEMAVASWFAELRDLSLHMSSNVGAQVDVRVERKLSGDAAARIKAGIDELVSDQTLTGVLQVPNAASDIQIDASLKTRTIAICMRLKARLDRKSSKARLNWVLKMLKVDDPRLHVRAHWPGRTASTMKSVEELRANPDLILPERSDALPHAFDVVVIERTGKRFAGRKTFIEDIERMTAEYYEIAGVHLREWHAAPPAPTRSQGKEQVAEANDVLKVSEQTAVSIDAEP